MKLIAMKKYYSFFLIISCTLTYSVKAQSITYVTLTGAGSQNGGSWTDAQSGAQLSAVIRALGEHDQVWIAEGTYYPHPTSRDSSFFVGKNVKIYGGFSGTETSIAARDWVAHPTILSGDIGIANDTADNSRHVLFLNNTYDSTVIDGLTITRGNANGQYEEPPINGMGGGVVNYCNNYPDLDARSNPRFYNCTFLKNYAFKGGGAYSEYNGGVNNPHFYNCTFDNNASNNQGGAYYAEMFLSPSVSPTFDSCRFVNNVMDTSDAPLNSQGGVLFLAKYDQNASNYITDVTIRNCYFENNAARDGGVITSAQGYNIIIDNCIFKYNYAQAAAVIYGNNSNYTITNCTIDSNSADNIIFFSTSVDNGQLAVHTKRYLTNTSFQGNLGYYTVVNQTGSPWASQHPTDSTYITNCLFFNNGQYGVVRAQAFPSSSAHTFLNNVTIYDDEDFVYQKAYDRQVLNLANNQSGLFTPGISKMYINNSIVWYPSELIGDRSIKSRTEGSAGGASGMVSTEVKHTIFRSGSGTWPAEAGTDGGGNLINSDPLFIDTLGNFRVNCSSPAVNAGLDILYPTAVSESDLDGSERLFGTAIDMGAYEQQEVLITIDPIVEVQDRTLTIDIMSNYTIMEASWTLGDGTTGTGTHLEHTYATDGAYLICLSVTTPCGVQDTCFNLDISGPSSIGDVSESVDFRMYPNPAHNIIWLDVDPKQLPCRLQIDDMTGRVVREIWIHTLKSRIDIEGLQPGMYLLRRMDGQEMNKGYKLLKY